MLNRDILLFPKYIINSGLYLKQFCSIIFKIDKNERDLTNVYSDLIQKLKQSNISKDNEKQNTVSKKYGNTKKEQKKKLFL